MYGTQFTARQTLLLGTSIPNPVQENAGALAFGPLPDNVMEDIEVQLQREPEGEPRKR